MVSLALVLLAGCKPTQEAPADGSTSSTCDWEGAGEADGWIDAAASADGADGSAEHPWPTIGSALAAGARGTLRIASGTYAEAVDLTDVPGVHLAGRCSDAVTIRGPSDGETPTVRLAGEEDDAWTLSGLTLEGGYRGIAASGGRLTGWDLRVRDNVRSGILLGLDEVPAWADLRDCTIADTVGTDDDPRGSGLSVWYGSYAKVDGCTLEGNAAYGVSAWDPPAREARTVDFLNGTIRETRSTVYEYRGAEYLLGVGMLAAGGAQVRVETTTLADNEVVAAMADGSDSGSTDTTLLDMKDVVVTGTVPVSWDDAAVSTGVALQAAASATATCEGCTFTDNACDAVFAYGEASEVDLENTTVSATARCASGKPAAGAHAQAGGQVELRSVTVEGTEGYGLLALDGSAVTCAGCTIGGNAYAGAIALGPEASLSLTERTIVRDTLPNEDGGGMGVVVQQDATALLDDVDVIDNVLGGVTVSGVADACSTEDPEACVPMYLATSATLRATIIDEVAADQGAGAIGLNVGYGATVTADGVSIAGVEGIGLSVAQAGVETTGELAVSGIVADPTSGRGAGVSVSAGSLTGEALRVEDVVQIGVSVFDAGVLDLATLDVRDPVAEAVDGRRVGLGLIASGGSTVTVAETTVTGATHVGVFGSGAETMLTLSRLTVEGTRVDDTAAWALAAGDGATIVVSGGTLSDNAGYGALAFSDAVLDLQDVTVERTQRYASALVSLGVVAMDGALVSAERLSVLDTEGPGISAFFDGTVECDACTLDGNGYANAQALQGTLSLYGGTTIGSAVADGQAGGGIGVLAADEPDSGYGTTRVSLTDVTVAAQDLAGVYVSGAGVYLLEGVTLDSAAADAVFGPWGNALVAVAGRDEWENVPGPLAWDGATGLSASGSTFAGSASPAVFLSGASANLCGNAYAAGIRVQQQRATQSVGGCDIVDVDTPAYNRSYDFYVPIASDDAPAVPR